MDYWNKHAQHFSPKEAERDKHRGIKTMNPQTRSMRENRVL
jgi:hypothetical protein